MRNIIRSLPTDRNDSDRQISPDREAALKAVSTKAFQALLRTVLDETDCVEEAFWAYTDILKRLLEITTMPFNASMLRRQIQDSGMFSEGAELEDDLEDDFWIAALRRRLSSGPGSQ